MITTDLTSAEREVLESAASGLTVAETARRRHVSPETIKTQRRKVLLKLGARRMIQAVRIYDEERAAAVRSGAGEITPGQLRAFHAKAGAVDKWLKREPGESKQLALAAAAAKFEHEIASANDLNELEASWCLDGLEAELRGGSA